MRSPAVTPTKQEFFLKEGDFIVSKTNSKGIITYCNKIFIEMSGYEEDELLGVNHNLVRHPDMPQIAYKVAWELIQSGKEFFGFVKNLRKDGGYYWVFTNISPDYDQKGNIIGYTSVRRKPNASAVATMMPIYKDLIMAEQRGGMSASGEAIGALLASHNMEYNELILTLQRSA